MTSDKYRVLIKLSGEALAGDGETTHGKSVFDANVFDSLVSDIADVMQTGKYEICLVVGGGNFVRITQTKPIGVRRVTTDHIGMLATIMNALALRDSLQHRGLPAVVQSAVSLPSFCETINLGDAERHIQAGRIVIFGGGTGNPFFTTDMSACVRAIEMNCGLMMKATKVDGVYSADPVKEKDAQRYRTISYTDVLKQQLGVMDAAAFGLARDHMLPMVVFSMRQRGALLHTLDAMCGFLEDHPSSRLPLAHDPLFAPNFTYIGDCATRTD